MNVSRNAARGGNGAGWRTWLPLAVVALAVGLATLLGGFLPIPEVAVGESLDPAQTLAARRDLDAAAQGLETIRGDVDRALRAADVQQLIGPATACETPLTVECAAQLRALDVAQTGWRDLLARLPDYERALTAYDNALMAQTRALAGAGEPLREATWPVVGAADQLGLVRAKYAPFFDPAAVVAVLETTERCAGLAPGSDFPAECAIAVTAALKTGQVIEARATVDDQYRRALDRYQRAVDERIAIISDGPRTGRLMILIDAVTIALVIAGGVLIAWRVRTAPAPVSERA